MLVFTYINNIESCIDIKLLFGLCKACMFLETVGLCSWVEMTLLSKSFDMATGKACLWRSCERLRFLFFLRILKHGNAIILIKNDRKPPGSQQFEIECQNQDGGASVLTLVSCASALIPDSAHQDRLSLNLRRYTTSPLSKDLIMTTSTAILKTDRQVCHTRVPTHITS